MFNVINLDNPVEHFVQDVVIDIPNWDFEHPPIEACEVSAEHQPGFGEVQSTEVSDGEGGLFVTYTIHAPRGFHAIGPELDRHDDCEAV